MAPLQPAVYVGTFIHCVSLTELEIGKNGAIGVDEKGVIAFVERDVREDALGRLVQEKYAWKDWNLVKWQDEESAAFFFPGFIDTHIHAPQLPNAGIFGKSTLLSWLQTYTFPLESSLSSPPVAQRVYTRIVASTLRNGTTTASYFATTHVSATNILAQICHAKGQRAFVGRCNMDSALHPEYYKDASPAQALRDTQETVDFIQKLDRGAGLVTPILTPRFAPSCTSELLQGLGDMHKATNLPIQTHVSENTAELALVASLFPTHDSYVHVYDAHGLLTPKTVLAHACHLSSAEVKIVKNRGSSVSHCPVSNSYLGSGMCPVRELLEEGVGVGLGTDVSGGWSCSVLVAAREAGGVSRLRTYVEETGARWSAATDDETREREREQMKLSIEECLYLATRGGAGCLGLEKTVGAFEVGMEWDAQVVDLGRLVSVDGEGGGMGGVELWGQEGWEERLAKWVHCGDERNTKAVWVKGRLVSGGMG